MPMPGTEGGSSTNTKASRSENILPRRSARISSLSQVARARSNGFSGDEDHAGVGRVGEGGAVEADERHGVLDARASS